MIIIHQSCRRMFKLNHGLYIVLFLWLFCFSVDLEQVLLGAFVQPNKQSIYIILKELQQGAARDKRQYYEVTR